MLVYAVIEEEPYESDIIHDIYLNKATAEIKKSMLESSKRRDSIVYVVREWPVIED
jgi:hypothetical protein